MPKLGMEQIRREQVIKAAKNLIIQTGVSNLSMKSIAKEAGISTGIIYHYFKNKEDVLLQVLKDSFRQSHEQVLQTVEPLENPKEKFFRHIENINAVPKENRDFYPIFLNYLGEAHHHPEIRQLVIKFFNNLRGYMDDYLQDTTQNIPNLSTIIYALGLGLGIMWTIDQKQYDMKAMEDSLKELFSKAIDSGKGVETSE